MVLDTAEYKDVILVTSIWATIYYVFMLLTPSALPHFSEGHKLWGQRTFLNLHEQSTAFIVGLWSHALFVSPAAAASIGFYWLAFRCLYPLAWLIRGRFTELVLVCTIPMYGAVMFLNGAVFAKAFYKIELASKLGGHIHPYVPLLACSGVFLCAFIVVRTVVDPVCAMFFKPNANAADDKKKK